MLAYDETIEARSPFAMRKLLQNTLFAAMTAWALYGVQAHIEGQEGSDHLAVISSPLSLAQR
jgi:hypothetical protein